MVRTEQEKKKVYLLINLGKSKAEVSRELKINPVTIRKWVNEWKIHDEEKLKIIRNLETFLNGLALDKESKPYEIMHVSVAIKNMTETLYLNPVKQLKTK